MLHGQKRCGRQMNKNATWPAEKGGHQTRADTSSDKPEKQKNRNVASPAENGGHQQRQTWETNE